MSGSHFIFDQHNVEVLRLVIYLKRYTVLH